MNFIDLYLIILLAILRILRNIFHILEFFPKYGKLSDYFTDKKYVFFGICLFWDLDKIRMIKRKKGIHSRQ